MSHFGSGVEYGLHCLWYLVDPPAGQANRTPPSTRDLAEYQGISVSYVAKLFTRLQKAGIVSAAEGVRGGFRLARPADRISVLDVVDALEGAKPLFECREVRARCVLYGDTPPAWATRGTCGIHAVINEAERHMRESLESHTLADIAGRAGDVVPARHIRKSQAWFQERAAQRPLKASEKHGDDRQ